MNRLAVLGCFLLGSFRPASAHDIGAQTAVGFKDLKVTRYLADVHKTSVVLESDQVRLRIDCLDGRQPTNTIMHLMAKNSIFSVHETFEGTSDFYCTGIGSVLMRGLSEGDYVLVRLPYEIATKEFGSSKYEVVTVSDIIFSVDGQDRKLSSNPGTNVKFESTEPRIESN